MSTTQRLQPISCCQKTLTPLERFSRSLQLAKDLKGRDQAWYDENLQKELAGSDTESSEGEPLTVHEEGEYWRTIFEGGEMQGVRPEVMKLDQEYKDYWKDVPKSQFPDPTKHDQGFPMPEPTRAEYAEAKWWARRQVETVENKRRMVMNGWTEDEFMKNHSDEYKPIKIFTKGEPVEYSSGAEEDAEELVKILREKYGKTAHIIRSAADLEALGGVDNITLDSWPDEFSPQDWAADNMNVTCIESMPPQES